MTKAAKTRCIGILTAGGDCPGLNAAIRGVVKAAIDISDIKVIGIRDGFRGLVENRYLPLDSATVSGILTQGGTILGTSRDKPHRMPLGGKKRDMTVVAVENLNRMNVDCLVCLGGGGTQKNALQLHQVGGVNVLTLPKTIDNDVYGTDITFGFNTALEIATEAIDRLHTTATSHHRIIVCEIMGHDAGWLTLGAGIAGGADVILIPEIPYDLKVIANHLVERRHYGKRFSIIAVAEGAISVAEAAEIEREKQEGDKDGSRKKVKSKEKKMSKRKTASEAAADSDDEQISLVVEPMASRIARELQALTGSDARVTSLGHVQRGGSPSATDRLLCTRLGTAAAEHLAAGKYNVMMAIKGEKVIGIPIADVAGRTKLVPTDHPWIASARLVGTCLGDK